MREVKHTRTSYSYRKWLHRLWQLLILATIVTAMLDVDWRIVVGLFAGAVASLLLSISGVAATQDNLYREFVLQYRSASEGKDEPKPRTTMIAFVMFFGSFLLAGFLSVYLNSPWPAIIAFVLAVVVGLNWYMRRNKRLQQVWREFAESNSLEFTPGNPLSRLDNPKIEGELSGRRVSLELSWAWQRSTIEQSENLFASIWLNGDSQARDVSFVIHRMDSKSDPDGVAKRIMDSRIGERIVSTAAEDFYLDDRRIVLKTSRIPLLKMELEFFSQLLLEIADEVESSA